jgi:hypothetical protein
MALVDATSSATVKALQAAISALVDKNPRAPPTTTAATASSPPPSTTVTVDAAALRAALGLPPANASGDQDSSAPADLTSLFAALGLQPPSAHDEQPVGSASGGAPLTSDAVDALHAQAVSVLNVKALVPVVLDIGAANYSKWCGLFLVTLGKYALSDHVLSDAAFPEHATWARMDCVVLTWLYGTIAADLLESVMQPDVTALQVWLCLEVQFLGHQEQRAMNLSAEFHNFVQGDLSANDYCRRLKSMADARTELGDPITDKQLVLAMLQGLNPRYENLQTILPLQRPFPSFIEARSQLILAEINKGSKASTNSSTALIAVTGGGGRGTSGGMNPAHATGFGNPSQHGQGGGGGNQGGGGNNKNRRRRGNGGANSGGNNSAQQPQGGGFTTGASSGSTAGAPRVGTAWPTPQHPWAGTIQMWPGGPLVRAPGILGPRPGATPFAGAVSTGPPLGLTQQAAYTDWYMDTGATSHDLGRRYPFCSHPTHFFYSIPYYSR